MGISAVPPSFADVAEFICNFAGLGDARGITPQTRLDADLGVTGDDGSDLLLQAAKHFNSRLVGTDGYVTTFGLAPNEYLFHAEGSGLPGAGALTRRLMGQPRHVVRDLTAGELHDAICRHGLPPAGVA